MAFILRNGSKVLGPRIRKNKTRAFLVVPADFFFAQKENPAQNKRIHALGAFDRVGKAQG